MYTNFYNNIIANNAGPCISHTILNKILHIVQHSSLMRVANQLS